ncbi:MAG: hypothetical protein LKF31_09000 [Muribaculaceae bacterium]|jgi:hypothetical protein|nr:hypothetical protein [Muribaculaceae bacterium]
MDENMPQNQQSAPVNGNATPNPVQPNPANMANMANMANQPGQTPTQPKTGFGASAGNFIKENKTSIFFTVFNMLTTFLMGLFTSRMNNNR